MKKFFVLFLALFFTVTTVNAEDFSVFKLDNGQTVIIEEVKNNPIVTIDTWIKTGSINEDDTNNGVSHFLEHLFFKGSTNHPTGEFDKILETKGAENNAATSKDFTHYYITIPSKDFDLAMDMHSDMLLHPLVPRKEMEKERKVVLEEIAKDANSPDSIVYDNLIDLMYKTHPYKRKVIGTSQVIENIPREKIMEYYNKFYKPSNMVTIVVGDVDTQKALDKIKTDFKSDAAKLPQMTYPKEKPITTQQRTVEKFDTNQGYMLIGFRGTTVDAKDSYALDVLSTILGQGRTSVFYRDIKDAKQLAYSISAANTGFKDDGIFYISANFAPDKMKQLEETIFEDIKNIQKNGITPAQLNTAQNMIERDTQYDRESISNIANEIGYTVVTTDDTKYYKDYISNIKKVTPQEVKKVAEKYLNQNQSAISILIPKTQIAEKQISNTTETKPATFVDENNGTQKYLLSNGATVLYTPNTSNDIVAISIIVKGGEFAESKTGTATLMNSVLLKGTTKYNKEDLTNLLEDNGIKIAPSSKADCLTLTVMTTKNEYDKTLDILSEVINNATLDDYEIEKARNDKLNAIKRSRDIPLNVAIEGYKTLIFENTPYSNSPKVLEQALPKVTRDDVLNYYNKIFNPKDIIISINGNVDKDKTLNTFSTMFKNAKDEKTFDYSVADKQIKPIQKPKLVTKQIKNLQTSWLILGWQAPGVNNQKDFATMQVIDTIIGTGMNSRMFRDIREQDGLAYQLGSEYAANMLRGAFVMYIGTNPKNIQTAHDKLFKEIYTLKREFVSTKELQDAKEKLIGRYVLSKETNLDKASTIGWFEATNRGYKFDSEYTKLINSVTESDIMEVSNKYFGDNYVYSVVKN